MSRCTRSLLRHERFALLRAFADIQLERLQLAALAGGETCSQCAQVLQLRVAHPDPRSVARVIAGLDARGMYASTNVIVVSDHGFSTHAGAVAPIRDVLAAFADDAIVAENAVNLRAGHEHQLTAIVRALQLSPHIGPVFTRHGVGGTLRYDAIGWEHARSGDVLFGANWSHDANAAGVKGSTRQAPPDMARPAHTMSAPPSSRPDPASAAGRRAACPRRTPTSRQRYYVCSASRCRVR